jgi:hypothetical protein
MKHYFIELTSYSAKNKAHNQLQKFVTPYQHMLTDSEEKTLIKSAIKQKIKEANSDNPRCKNIELSGWHHDNETLSVDSNFILTFKEVKSYRLSPTMAGLRVKQP